MYSSKDRKSIKKIAYLYEYVPLRINSFSLLKRKKLIIV